MTFQAERVDIWTTDIPDKPGGLDAVLEPLSEAGVDLEFLLARREAGKRGKGVVFLAGVQGSTQARRAREAGLSKTQELVGVRVQGTNKPGAARQITRFLAEGGINLRGLSATAIGRRFTAFLAFDSRQDATKAVRLLNQAQGPRKKATKKTARKKKTATKKR